MWLIMIGIVTIIASFSYFIFKNNRTEYKLDVLTLMYFGTLILVIIDHINTYYTTGVFFQTTTNGFIRNATVLGVVMVMAIFIVWITFTFGTRILNRFNEKNRILNEKNEP